MQVTISDRYYRPDEVAELLNVDKSFVYRQCREVEKPMPSVRIGGVLRIPGPDLKKWLEERKRKPEEE